jgi:ABC-type branched-subunit amino acid transport system ATPase component
MNFKRAITALIFFLAIIVSHTAFAQTNMADVRVDDLTDTQVRQLMQKAASVGYTDDAQIAQMAIAQGMSPDEAQKLTLRIDKLKKTTVTIKITAHLLKTVISSFRPMIIMDDHTRTQLILRELVEGTMIMIAKNKCVMRLET